MTRLNRVMVIAKGNKPTPDQFLYGKIEFSSPFAQCESTDDKAEGDSDQCNKAADE